MDSNYKLLDRLLELTDSVTQTETVFLQFVERLHGFNEKAKDASSSADVKKYVHWIPLDHTIVKKFQKNNKISASLRNNGNAAYRSNNFLDAVRSYNLAIAFAENLEEAELALAYGNRSAALNCLGLTEQALIDIDLAILKVDPKNVALQNKWIDRKKKIEAKINGRINNPAFEKQLKDALSERNIFYKEMFTLKSPNPLAPALEDSVSIAWHPKRGRHLVANCDIPIGSTVLVERPFTATLREFQYWEVNYCHHCYKKNLLMVPCPNCVFTLYCNENCRTEAQKYHQYECPCLPDLYCLIGTKEISKMYLFLLAFKLACLLGPRKLFDIFTQRKQTTKNSAKHQNRGNIRGIDPDTGIYSSDSYDALFHLTTEEIPENDLGCVAVSLIQSDVLMSNSNFFDFLTSVAEKTEFRVFIADFFYQHFRTFGKNVFTMGGLSSMDCITLRTDMESKLKEKLVSLHDQSVTAAYATASLFNHSCYPNVEHFCGKKFATMAVVSVTSVKKGEELLISYGPSYGDSVEEHQFSRGRQAILYRNYEFKCDCIACKYDWLPVDSLILEKPVFCCPLCTAKCEQKSKISQLFNFQLSRHENFQCKVCKVKHSEEVFLQDGLRYSQKMVVCQNLILRNSPVAALPDIKSAMIFWKNTLLPPKCIVASLQARILFVAAVDLIIFFSDIE